MLPNFEPLTSDSPTPQAKEKKVKRDSQKKKKSAIIDNEDVSKKNSFQQKLTAYYKVNQNGSSNQQSTLSDQLSSSSKRAKKLEEELKQKEGVIQGLQIDVKNEQKKNTKLSKQYTDLKENTQMVLADLKLQSANQIRRRNGLIINEYGYFKDDKGNNFVEGQYIEEIKERIKKVEKTIREQQFQKSLKVESEKYYMTAKIHYHQKLLVELKAELTIREKQVNTYKQKLQLYNKQKKCTFALESWPLINKRYLPLFLIGNGGFGQVYKGYDIQKYQDVAIKIGCFDPLSENFEKFASYLNKQMKIHKQLSHPNIVKMLDQFQLKENRAGFVMEYCTGPELRTYLKRLGCLDERQSKNIVKQLICAIKYLQQQKYQVVHYDLKPANILFHHGVVKILDFGISKQIDKGQSRADITTFGVGTYWYLPPETFQSQSPKFSGKVDIWSVGVIFYELLYGKKPFGNNMNASSILKSGAILNARTVEFPEHSPKHYRISDEAKQFIKACLQYQPANRLNYLQAYNHEYLQ